MNNPRCVVFGGGGFLGSHLVEQLLKKNFPVIVFARGSKTDNQNLSSVMSRIEFIKGDFNNFRLVSRIIKPNDVVFDLIASSVPFSSMQLPIEEIKKHIFSHVQLIKTAAEKRVKKIIFFSSGGAVYQEKDMKPVSEKTLLQPASPHAISKTTIEYYLNYFSHIHQTPYLIYRLSNPYGPRQVAHKGFAIVPTLFNKVIKNKRPTLFNHGGIIRDFIYVDDAIEAITKSFNKKNQYSVYNIGSGRGTSLKTLWLEIQKITQTSLKPKYQPKRPIDRQAIILNINRFKHEYRWQPKINLPEGLKKTWQTY